MRFSPAVLCVGLALTAVAAHATPLTGVFNVTVHEGLSNGVGFDTKNGDPYSGGATATFVYTGALDFSNMAAQNEPGKTGDQNDSFGFTKSSISNYSGSGTVSYGNQNVANFNTLEKFLNSSGSASGYAYGSYFTLDLGQLLAGTTLTMTHDDGLSLFQGGTQIGSTLSGPTGVTTDVVTLPSSGGTILRYARENGTPSVLQVTAVAATPEPSSLALLGTGVLGLVGAVRRRMA